MRGARKRDLVCSGGQPSGVCWLAKQTGGIMPYLTEADVRRAALSDVRILNKSMDSAALLQEHARSVPASQRFDIFLCHSIRDADIVHGAKKILERNGRTVYVDWIVDPQMDRSTVTAETAGVLRSRMNNCDSLLYLFSSNSKRSRWMPWELGYFDGHNGTVGILPVVPSSGVIDFSQEEYLGLYPKVEIDSGAIFIHKTKDSPVPANASDRYMSFRNWVGGTNKLRL